MQWKVWMFFVGAGMLVLAIIGLVFHASMRLVGADVVGALAAASVVVLAPARHTAIVRALAAVAFLIMAILAMTSHAPHWLVALTLAGAFAFGFMSWTAISSKRGMAEPPRPRPT
jgi:hypothetical protein